MATTRSTEKHFQDDMEPFPEIPGVPVLEPHRKEWNVIVEHLKKKEEDRCSIWKEEVENLTIYAGLFSAVVTAFIVESSKSLQNSPSDILLSKIVILLERGANATNSVFTSSVPDSLSVTSANKGVNALWFMSLVLSLSSALIGLVGLQWIREHLRPSSRNVPLRTLPAILQMQADSLDAYYIPLTFTALPLLLIISIVLFFVGLIVYLWNINYIVAYPSIVTISLILAFVLYTTIRPGLQGLPDISSPRSHSSNPTPAIPCPYRSPQAWAFLQVAVFISSIPSFIYRCLPSPLLVQVSETKSTTKPTKDWIDWALGWPRIRDIHQNLSGEDQHGLLQPLCNKKLLFPPIYDTIRALTQAKQDFMLMGHVDFEKAMVDVICVFKDTLICQQGSQGYANELLSYTHDVLDEPCLPLSLPRSIVSQGSVGNLNDLTASVPNLMHSNMHHLLQLACDNLGAETETSGSPIALTWYKASRTYLAVNIDDAHQTDLNHVAQLAIIVNKTIMYASQWQGGRGTLGTSSYVKTLLHAVANIIVSRASPTFPYQYHAEAIQLNDDILTRIQRQLNQYPQNPYLFLLCSIYAHFLLVEVSPLFVTNPVYARTQAFDEAALILMQRHAELHSSNRLHEYQESIFPRSLEPDFTWAYLDPQYGKVQENSDEDDGEEGNYEPEDEPSMPLQPQVTGLVSEREDKNNDKEEISTIRRVAEGNNMRQSGGGPGGDADVTVLQPGTLVIAAHSSSGSLPAKRPTNSFVPGDVFITSETSLLETNQPAQPSRSLSSIQATGTVPIRSVDPEGREDPSAMESTDGPNRGDAVVEMSAEATADSGNPTIIGLD